MLIGEMAALATAFCWALAATVHGAASRILGPLQLNLIRLPLSVLMLSILCLIAVSDFTADPATLYYMVISGVVGLALGDTLLYAGMMRLNTRIAVLIFSMAPALTVFMAWFFLNERLGAFTLAGIGLTMAGIVWVVAEKSKGSGRLHQISPAGVGLVFGSAICQAASIILMKKGLTADVHTLYATLLRLGAGGLVLWPLAIFSGKVKNPVRLLVAHPEAIKLIVVGSLTGPVIGIWLSMVAVKYTAAAVAATLIATQPILVIPVTMVMEKERPTARALAGTLLAFAGTAILFLS